MDTFLAVAVVAAAAIALAVLAVLAYALGRRRRPTGAAEQTAPAARWYQYLLAAALLTALLALAGYVFYWGLSSVSNASAAADDWRAGSKTTIFLALLLLGCGLALLVFLAALLARLPPAPITVTAATAQATAPLTPSGLRLLGLLLVLVAILLLGWLYLPPGQRYSLSVNLLYPASFAVALVLLFDKASRAWNPKSTAANFREWLYCDLLALGLVLGYLNLLRNASAETYGAFFWDAVHLTAFFSVFWLLDRKLTRYRFLVVNGYLLLLPWLLQLWLASLAAAEQTPAEAAHDAARLAAASWWHGAWPLSSLALVFLLLEIIALLASKEAETKALTAVKDTLFIALYVIFIIAAIPAAPA